MSGFVIDCKCDNARDRRETSSRRREVFYKNIYVFYCLSIFSLYINVQLFVWKYIAFFLYAWVSCEWYELVWLKKTSSSSRNLPKDYIFYCSSIFSLHLSNVICISHTHTHEKQTLMILCPCSRNSTRRKNNWRRRGNERKLIMERRERHGRSRTIRSQRPRNLLLLVRNENQNQSLLPRRVVVVNPNSFLLRLEVERKRDRRKN